MIFFKVEKEKDGATIKSKKNAEGRKVRLNIYALVALFYPCGGGTLEFIHKERLLRLEKKTERQKDKEKELQIPTIIRAHCTLPMILFYADDFQVWMCEVVTPVPASKLWEKLQVFIDFSF